MNRIAALLLLLSWALPLQALPDRVLLVGVSKYAPEVVEIAPPLRGPGNDVGLMYHVFKNAGVTDDQFRVLSDEPATLPEQVRSKVRQPGREEILSALDDLARNAQPGEEIVVFLAGHGAQIPAVSMRDEPDGLDEVFLPSGFSLGAQNEFQNAIADHEIGARIDQMVAAGAHVWLVADTCHSGSLRRSDGVNAVSRLVDLSGQSTGKPDPGLSVDLAPIPSDAAGSFVGFYAASAGSLTFETIPVEAGVPHGTLTWALAQALRNGRAETYRSLASEVTKGLFKIDHGRSNPAFSGTLASRHVLADTSDANGFPIAIEDEVLIFAGKLDGLEVGTRVAIQTDKGETLFQTHIEEAVLTRSRAFLPSGGTPKLDGLLMRENLDPERFRERWLVDRAPQLSAVPLERALNFSLRIDVSKLGDTGVPLQLAKKLGPSVDLVDQQGAFSLEQIDDRIYLSPTSEGAAEAMSVSASPVSIEELSNLLHRVAKARALHKIAENLETSPLSQVLDVDLSIATGVENEGNCKPGEAARRVYSVFAPMPIPVMHCDRVTVAVSNHGADDVDITPLYIAADRQVYFLQGYQNSEKGGWRIKSGASGKLTYTEATRLKDGSELATGAMHLLLLAVKAPPDGDPIDFRYLQASSPPSRQRAGFVSGLSQLLDTAGFGLALRRSIGQHVMRESGARVIAIETVSDAEFSQRNN